MRPTSRPAAAASFRRSATQATIRLELRRSRLPHYLDSTVTDRLPRLGVAEGSIGISYSPSLFSFRSELVKL